MKQQTTYDFVLDKWTPETLPMARFCQYLEQLVLLFGNKEAVHFNTLRKGSAIQQISVDAAALAQVQERVGLLGQADAPDDIKKVQRAINRMLREDDCSGTLKLKGGAKVYQFLGRNMPLAEEVVVHEAGQLDGEVIRVGGRDDSVPVWLKDGNGSIHKCSANKNLARELAQMIFGPVIRVSGNAKWRRNADQVWQLEEFIIKTVEPLDQYDLMSVVAQLRAVPGSDWNSMPNPQQVLRALRSDE